MVTIGGIKIADIGFYINLDKRQDRKKKIEEQLIDFKISGVNRYSAFNEYDSNTLNCKRSHFNLMEKLLDSDFETILILEDDCLFLDFFKTEYKSIIEDINKTDWDIFWLGCRNRRPTKDYKNNCFNVSSVSYTQSYILKRNVCEFILNNFNNDDFYKQPVTPDEFLCLVPYGKDVVLNPNNYNFYNLEQPLDNLPTFFKSLCYKKPLTTQYSSFSDLWNTNVNYEEHIKGGYPK